MRSTNIFLAVVLVLVPSTSITYANIIQTLNGPQHSSDQCKNVGTQSPIDIVYKNSVYDAQIANFVFGCCNPKVTQPSFVLENTGHYANIKLKGDHLPTVSGGGLPHTYQLAQLQFHWDSEHTLNGRSYPLEMQSLHFAIGNGVPKNEKIAMLNVLFSLSDTRNSQLDFFINKLRNVTKTGTSVNLQDVTLLGLVPARSDRFFRYSGSLTTPPCTEHVIWTVFHDTIPISANQLAEFQRLLDTKGKSIKSNNRPIQTIGSRQIRASFPASTM